MIVRFYRALSFRLGYIDCIWLYFFLWHDRLLVRNAMGIYGWGLPLDVRLFARETRHRACTCRRSDGSNQSPLVASIDAPGPLRLREPYPRTWLVTAGMPTNANGLNRITEFNWVGTKIKSGKVGNQLLGMFISTSTKRHKVGYGSSGTVLSPKGF